MKKIDLQLVLVLMTFVFGIGMVIYFDRINQENSQNQQTKENKNNFKVIQPQENEPLRNPIDLAVIKTEKIFVTDSDQHRIQVFNHQGDVLYRFGEYGSGEGQLNYPVGIVLDTEKNVYIAELYNQRISVFSETGTYKYAISFEHTVPTAIAIDQNNHLYVIDKADQTVKKLTTKGEVLKTFGGLGNSNGKFQYPLGLAVAEDGTIYVSDTGNNRIQVFNQTGKLIEVVKVPMGPPSGIAVDAQNQIYFTEPTNGQVMNITQKEKSVEQVFGAGEIKDESLFFPEGIEIVGNLLYCTDKGTNRVIIYKLTKK